MRDLPAFPTYHGPPLPEVLSLLNPRHYWLLVKWIYLQPSRLKHYLFRVDPELYQAQSPGALARSLRIPVYRNLYLISMIHILFLSSVLAWLASAVQGTAVDWLGVAFGVGGGVALGVVFVVAGGLSFGLAFGVVFGVAFGVVFGAAFGITFGVVFGLASGAAFGVAGGLAFGVAFGMGFIMAFGMAFGVAGGVTFIVALLAALTVAFGVTLVVVGGTPVVAALIVAIAVLAVGGGSRVLLLPLEWLQARFLARSRGDPCLSLTRHPVLWDEYCVWPLPGTASLLQASLVADLDRGLKLAIGVAANPFQRWTVQRALSDLLCEQPDSLAALYRLAYSPALDEYVIPPTRHFQFQTYPSARLVLLGEIGQRFVAACSEATQNTEFLIWQATRRLRWMRPTPLSQFSALLYRLLRKETELEKTEAREIKLAEQFEPVYEAVRQLEHGGEVADSFATITSFLETGTIEALAAAHQHLGWANELAAPPLRPPVIEALKALGDVSQDVAAYVRSTNTGQKSAALNRAAGELNELAGYVQRGVLPPERVLLNRVVVLWQSMIDAEQGHLGEAALQGMAPAARRAAGILERTSAAWQHPATPFDNPYIVGDPVYPPLLVGRKDVFDRIGEIWTAKKNPDSIILYGHRRMGKSTILRNLDQVAPTGSVVVYADMAGETSFVESTADLLLGLADRIYRAVRRVYAGAVLPEPEPETYATPARAQFQLNRLMESVHDTLGGCILIMALDEFEAVQKAVEEGKVEKEIYQFLRAKTQEPWLTLVFGGLHTLDEMSRDYQQPFYGSYENIRVSYLAREDAWRLIANPTDEFTLDYAPEAIERIIAATGGQPYLVQQICRDALDHLNHELFDLALAREVRIIPADVEAVLNDDFFRRGTVYFDGVWVQASDRDQRLLLRAMARGDEPWTLNSLEAATGLDADTLRRQVGWAERHDILHEAESGRWKFCVPLMRQWIQRNVG